MHLLTHLFLLLREHEYLVIALPELPLQSTDLFLAHVYLVLVCADLKLALFVHLLLFGHEIVHVLGHVLDLLGLCMVDICLSTDLLVTLTDLLLRVLILVTQLSEAITTLGQLDLHIAEGVLQLLVFHFRKSQHLPAFLLSTLVTFHT